MNKLDENILIDIFIHIDHLNQLLKISTVCRQWRKIIFQKDFFQKRFLCRRQKSLIYHWKFNKISNLGLNTNQFYQTGHLQEDICFLGSCLLFDAHSSLTIPLNNCQNQHYSISLWIQNTSSVNSWRTIFEIILFESRSAFIHLGITPLAKIEYQISFDSNKLPKKCRSIKQSIIRHLWYHLVILISSNKQILFINGQVQREIQTDSDQDDQLCLTMKEIHIGTDSKGFSCWFGRIADLSIWNRWLDSIEIRAIYQQRVSIDQTDLGNYFKNNCNIKQVNHLKSVLL